MKPIRMVSTMLFCVVSTFVAFQRLPAGDAAEQLPSPRALALKTSDGVTLEASYFAAGKPGPGVLLYHQSNRTRTSWEGVARQLAAA